jgi:hypothetical protein
MYFGFCALPHIYAPFSLAVCFALSCKGSITPRGESDDNTVLKAQRAQAAKIGYHITRKTCNHAWHGRFKGNSPLLGLYSPLIE